MRLNHALLLASALTLAGCGKQQQPSADAGPTSSAPSADPTDGAVPRVPKIHVRCDDPHDPTWNGGAIVAFVYIPTTTVWKPEKPGDKVHSHRRIFNIFCPGLAVGTACDVTELDADAVGNGVIGKYQLHHRREFTISAVAESVYTLSQERDFATFTIDFGAQVVKYAVDEPRKQGRPAPVTRGEGPCPIKPSSAPD